MLQKTLIRQGEGTIVVQPRTLHAILQEIRLLRHQISSLFPQDDLSEYAHAKRVGQSYRKAMKRYPPLSR